MTLFDLILIAVSLSMDAFAVSICKGLSVRKVSLQPAMICGVWFGGFKTSASLGCGRERIAGGGAAGSSF